jgi:serine protease Do
VKSIIDELKSNGAVDRGWLGVQLQNIDDDLADSLGLDSEQGALVADVVADSPAERGGINVGDVILGYEDSDVKDARELSKLVGASDNGDRVSMSIWRNDKLIDVDVVLGDAAASNAVAGNEKDFKDLGLTVTPLNDELRQRFNIEPGVTGAVVVKVDPDGKAAEHGLLQGDVLLQVDRAPISSLKDLEKSLAKARKKGRSSVPVLVRRGDVQQFATLPVA